MLKTQTLLRKVFALNILVIFIAVWIGINFATSPDTLQLFPIHNYNQNLDNYIKPSDPSHQKALVKLEYQTQRLKEFYNHYFSSNEDGLSPWSEQYVTQTVTGKTEKKQTNENPIFQEVKELLEKFSNKAKDPKHTGYGENYRPYPVSWIEKIDANLDIKQFDKPFHYNTDNRGILIKNTYARALPTLDPHFYSHELPGEGYPFDNLQMSALWLGTPVYILGQTLDKQWSFIITPDVTAWVQTESIAKTNQKFINHWQKAAKNKLAAIKKTETAIVDTQNKNYTLKAYVGTVLPFIKQQSSKALILFPARTADGFAQIRQTIVNNEDIAAMPLIATPENFSRVIKTLQNRPYGWGGLYFYNDCSAELKNLYTPFGIWLPRHSADEMEAGKVVDKNSATSKERIEYLAKEGRPFMTIVYNTKHVFMYLGNSSRPMTYQNVWALKPQDFSRRAVIGQSVIFPLLENYPEDSELASQANSKDFKVIYLDEWPDLPKE